MSHSYHHAVSSVAKFGGYVDDYLEIHRWIDGSKAHYADVRHRALRHHSEGIFLCERLFGVVLTNSDGKEIPVRQVAEQHVIEDCGFIPSVQDWLSRIDLQDWMGKVPVRLSIKMQECSNE